MACCGGRILPYLTYSTHWKPELACSVFRIGRLQVATSNTLYS
jgi:hypothetical protein